MINFPAEYIQPTATLIGALFGALFGGFVTYLVQCGLAKSKLKQDRAIEVNRIISLLLKECRLFLISQDEKCNNPDGISYLENDREAGVDDPTYYQSKHIVQSMYCNRHLQDFFREEIISHVIDLKYLIQCFFNQKVFVSLVAEIDVLIMEYHEVLPEYQDNLIRLDLLYEHVEMIQNKLKTVNEKFNDFH
ncbi:MAG: hypothetical protein U1E78_11880 [Gammaproteobacteria bacterium]